MNCPVCSKPMKSQRGSQMDPTDGWTVWCPHRDCPAQEVSGHSGSVSGAEKIVHQKFTFGRTRDEDSI